MYLSMASMWNINITDLLIIYTNTNCFLAAYCLAEKFNLHQSIQAKEIILLVMLFYYANSAMVIQNTPQYYRDFIPYYLTISTITIY